MAKILKNRGFAWVLTALLMVISLFMGSFLSFNQMRMAAQDAYNIYVLPELRNKMQLAHEMQQLYMRNAPEGAEAFIAEGNDLFDWIAFDSIDIAAMYEVNQALTRHFNELYRRASALENIVEGDRQQISNTFLNLENQDRILAHEWNIYNEAAQAFNARLNRGLGFLVQLAPVNLQMPVFS